MYSQNSLNMNRMPYFVLRSAYSTCGVPTPSHPVSSLRTDRRICRGDFTDFSREGISALGSLPLWGTSKFHLRVKGLPSLPGVDPKPPFSPILDSTGGRSLLCVCRVCGWVGGGGSVCVCVCVCCVCVLTRRVEYDSRIPAVAATRNRIP